MRFSLRKPEDVLILLTVHLYLVFLFSNSVCYLTPWTFWLFLWSGFSNTFRVWSGDRTECGQTGGLINMQPSEGSRTHTFLNLKPFIGEVLHQCAVPSCMTAHVVCLHYNTCKWRLAAAEQTHIWTIWWPGATKQGRWFGPAIAIPITLCDSPVNTVKSFCFPGTIIIQELKWELNISSISTAEDVLPGEVQPAKVNNDALLHRRHWVDPQSKFGTRGGCSESFCWEGEWLQFALTPWSPYSTEHVCTTLWLRSSRRSWLWLFRTMLVIPPGALARFRSIPEVSLRSAPLRICT